MKRYLCTVAAGMLLALASTATASANDLPVVGQTGTQVASFGDQTVGEQKNDADVMQEQGNGNVAITPAIAVGGDAETTNKQGNGNTANADVDQKNSVDQTQSSEQRQSLDSSDGNGCCDGQSQAGEQKTYGGDQTVEKQGNDADVTQRQGNDNFAFAPAIAIGGDAKTTNYQGNGNDANADVDQKNSVDQTQSSEQRQSLDSSDGNGCCDGQSQTGEQKTYGGDQTVEKQRNDADVTQEQGNGNVWIGPAIAIGGDAETRNYQGNDNEANADVDQRNDIDQTQSSTQKQYIGHEGGSCCDSNEGYGHGHGTICCDGSSQVGEQKTSFGDQKVGKQANDADVTQEQGNGNFAFAPAVAIGHGQQHGSCYSKCGSYDHGSDAETTNKQGNGNTANADVDQKNSVDQTQTSTQKQELESEGDGCCKPTYGCTSSDGCKSKKDYDRKKCCESGSDQTGTQKTYFGDQSVGEQRNDAGVTQRQGNDNVAYAPAWAFEHGTTNGSCGPTCGSYGHGGDAETTNKQGNGNTANADVDQKSSIDQTQLSYQRQSLIETCEGLVA